MEIFDESDSDCDGDSDSTDGLFCSMKEDKIGHVEKTEIITIGNALKNRREKNWNERADRTELEQLLQKDCVDAKYIANKSSGSQFQHYQPITGVPEQRNESIYKLQLNCGLESDAIFNHCAKLRAMDSLLIWGIANGKFNNLSDAFEWSCLYGKEELKKSFLSESETLGFLTDPICTFRKTKKEKDVLKQIQYHCKDCNLVDENGVCNACAKICHVNHDLTFSNYSKSFFCNCGANPDGSCYALNLPQVNDICTFKGTKKENVFHHVYVCKTCDSAEVCSRCIKTCHKSHFLVYKGYTDTYCNCECKFEYDEILSICKEEESVEQLISWVKERFVPTELGLLDSIFQWSCRNGKDNLTEYLISHSEELGTQFYRTCTFRLTSAKKTKLKQVWYHCNTCNMIGNEGVCNACAKICHADHDVVYANYNTKFFCNCGNKQDCTTMILPQDSKLCTLTSTTKRLWNHYHGCLTCKMTKSGNRDICTSCVEKCHKDHETSYQGFRNASCDCGIEKYGECQALVSSNGEKIIVINDGKW